MSVSARSLDRFATTVDHEGLVADAGLILARTLMARLGLSALIERLVRTGAAGSSRGVGRFVGELVANLRRAGAAGPISRPRGSKVPHQPPLQSFESRNPVMESRAGSADVRETNLLCDRWTMEPLLVTGETLLDSHARMGIEAAVDVFRRRELGCDSIKRRERRCRQAWQNIERTRVREKQCFELELLYVGELRHLTRLSSAVALNCKVDPRFKFLDCLPRQAATESIEVHQRCDGVETPRQIRHVPRQPVNVDIAATTAGFDRRNQNVARNEVRRQQLLDELFLGFAFNGYRHPLHGRPPSRSICQSSPVE